ncbi:MAG: arylsulfotransferase family protein [Sphingobium sp.]
MTGDNRATDQSDDLPSGPLEKILFAKIELWLVLLVLIIGCLGVIGFGAAVLDGQAKTGKYGAVSRVALNIAEIPDTAKRMLRRDTQLIIYNKDRFKNKPTGWNFPLGRPAGLSGYILFSRYDGTAKRHAIELLSLPDMHVTYRWTLDVDELVGDVTHASRFSDHDNWNEAHFREIHPWLESNGDLIVKDHYSPLMRVDPCGKRRWINQQQVFHHSTEADESGNLWIPSLAEKHSLKGMKDSFREDMLTKVSPAGKILFNRSVAQILIHHGYANWLFATDMYNDDPTHLNDIEPVMRDGPYWKKGDVFVSLRNVSAVLLYRPSTDQIVWMKRGPWMSQHDVDILDDHRISVYDNAAQDFGHGGFVNGTSQIMIYDFATNKLSTPLVKAMKDNNMRTVTAGLFTLLPGGSMMLEDVTNAQFLILRADGKVVAEYTNRAQDGEIYHLGWNRYIDKATGDAVLQNLRKVQCHA